MRRYYTDHWLTLYQGDVQNCLADIPAESVQCVVTSPPYWGLRNYGVEGQIGLEETPEEHVQGIVEIFREVRRVLRRDGVLWLNYGDCYTSGNRVGHGTRIGYKQQTNRGMNGTNDPRRPATPAHLKPKDLCGMPWRVALALQDDGWWLRSDCIWHKPNAMPESVTDRPTHNHEYVFLLTKAARYFYDAEAVREANISKDRAREKGNGESVVDTKIRGYGSHCGTYSSGHNLRSVWTIPTQSYPNAHFATFPHALARTCILAGTSAKGCCGQCGAPWKREISKTTEIAQHTGWQPTCTCNAPTIPCTVLDPFAGSGTTLAVARDQLRRSVGIELNTEYCQMVLDRVMQLALPLGGT